MKKPIGTRRVAHTSQRLVWGTPLLWGTLLFLTPNPYSLIPAFAQAPALTTVKDTVYKSDGTLAEGTVVITWQPFLSGDSKPVFGGSKTAAISDGALAVELTPNAGATPAGTSYSVRYYQSGSVFSQETWVVPTSSPLATPSAPTVTPQGTPGSTTYCYWITAKNATGETRLSAVTCITNGAATLNGTDYNLVDWPDVSGATSYRVFRTNSSTAPTGTCPGGAHPACGVAGTPSSSTLDDQSSSTSSGIVPTVNDTDPKLLSVVRVTAAPVPSVVIGATQVTGTAVVQTPSGSQTITAASAGIPLQVKGKSGNSSNVFEVYDNQATPQLKSFINAGGDLRVQELNAVRFADQFAGATAGAKIAAACTDLPSTGGTIDARGLEAAQTISSDPFVSCQKPVHLMLGAATYTTSVCVVLPKESVVEGMLGYQSELEDVGKGTVIDWSSTCAFKAVNSTEIRGLSFENYVGTGTAVIVQDQVGGDAQAGGVAIRNSSFQGGLNGIQLIGFGDLLVESNTFQNYNGAGVVLGGGTLTNSAFAGVNITNNLFNAASQPTPSDATRFVDISGTGNYLLGARIQGNWFQNLRQNNSIGLDISGYGISIQGNYFDNIGASLTGSYGILVTTGTAIDITANAFNATSNPISLVGVDESRIGYNRFTSAENNWIALDSDSDRNEVSIPSGATVSLAGSGNLIHNSTGLGIGRTPTQKLTAWDGNAEIVDPATLGSESLTDGTFTNEPGAGKWGVSGGWDASFTGNKANYSGSAGNLTQIAGDMAVAGTASRWYKFVYTVSSPTGTIGATITTAFASASTTLPLTAGAQTVYFQTAASPGTFTISGTGTGSFSLDGLSLKEVNGGNLIASGQVSASGLSVTATGGVLATVGNLKIGNAPGLPGTLGIIGHSALDQSGFANYALMAINDGETKINAATGKTIDFDINNTDVATISSTGLNMVGRIVESLEVVTFSTTPTFDAALGNSFKMTLTDNVSSSTISNPQTGQFITLLLCQDGNGSRTMTWPTSLKLAGGTFTLTTTLDKCDSVTAVYDGSNWYETARAANL